MIYDEFLSNLQRHKNYLLNIAYKILKENADAKDLLQDQILEWLQNEEWLKVETSFKGWFGNRIRSRASSSLVLSSLPCKP